MCPQVPPLRLAFIGGYGHHYLRGALEDAACTIDALAVASDGVDSRQTRQRFDTVLSGGKWFEDPIAMMDDFAPNVISFGGVFAHNAPLIVAALRRGIHCVTDKPLATTWADLHAIEDAVDGRAVVVTEFNFRSVAAFRAAREAVIRGEVGDVALATAQKSYKFGQRPAFYADRDHYGSTMLWIASHGFDSICFTTEQNFKEISAVHGNRCKPAYGSMEDYAVATFTLEQGGVGLVHADLLRPEAASPYGDDRLRLIGSAGVVEIRDGRCWLTTHDQAETDITDRGVDTLPHRDFLSAIFNGDDSRYGTQHSLALGHILLHARDAADHHTWRKMTGIAAGAS